MNLHKTFCIPHGRWCQSYQCCRTYLFPFMHHHYHGFRQCINTPTISWIINDSMDRKHIEISLLTTNWLIETIFQSIIQGNERVLFYRCIFDGKTFDGITAEVKQWTMRFHIPYLGPVTETVMVEPTI